MLLYKELEYFAEGFHDYQDLDSQGAKLVVSGLLVTTSIIQFSNINLLMRKYLNPRVLITTSEGGIYIIICQVNDILLKSFL